MARKKTDIPAQPLTKKAHAVPELPSESESDNEMGYKLPHYAASTSDSTPRTANAGTPQRPIKIPDVKSAGTPDEPIWISDADITDNDTETDTSNAAIRGMRTPKTRPSRSPVAHSTSIANRRKSQGKSEKAISKPGGASKKVLKVAARVPTAETPPRTVKAKKSPAGKTLAPKKAPPVSSSPRATIETAKQEHIQIAPKSPKSPKVPSQQSKASLQVIDITALSDETDDLVLEKELEEIALDGRSGMISGTPGAHDIEKGNQSFTKPVAPIVEDEADRSWHTPFADGKPKNFKRQRWYLLLSVLGLLAITGCLVYVLVSKDNGDSGIQGTEPSLSERQQTMHDIVTRVTDSAILSNPNTPQFKARRWLLFRDKDIVNTTEERVVQRYALACFYFATSGEEKWNNNNWLSGDECATEPWYGIDCNPLGNVRTIAIDNGGLSGTIPPEVGHFGKLEHIILKNNPGLFGWIPSTLGHIRSLSQIGLYKNALSGTIPDIFQHANQIKYINLEDNHMYGSIPPGIQHLSKLDTLALGNNKFDGIVPVDALAKTTLKFLSLSGNEFSSTLEHSIKEMGSIEHLYLNNNKMRGPIPEEIGALTNLKSLDLGGNQFTGEIPGQIGNLVRLEFLSMNNNRLEGALPRELALLTGAKMLNLGSNKFVGTLPNIFNMIHLVNLQLQENELTGTIPEAIQQLQSIEILLLSSNKLTGTIPSTIDRLSRTLRGLYLSDNAIKGRIATDLCNFGSLEALFLDTNELFGPIPSCLGDLAELRQMYLFQNQLTGQVPSSFSELRQLGGLGLEENGLTGEMPDGVCALVEDFSLDIWADCTDQFGSEPLLCDCCSVCCPSDRCT